MGCFGDMEETKKVAKNTTQTTSPPEWVESASKHNYDLASKILSQGFQPYTGQMVAPLSDNERAAGDMVAQLAGTGGASPNLGTSTQRISDAGVAPAFNYDFSTVVDPSLIGSIDSYMSPYLEQVLAPTLRKIQENGVQQRQGINANATAAGAYGDARHGVVEGAQRRDEGQTIADTAGKTFGDAFNTAMGLRTSDLQRLFGTQQAQATADESALSRMRQSGIDLSSLDQTELGRLLGITTALGQTGANERNVAQAQNTADYNEFMRKTNFTNDEIAFLTSILSGTPVSKTVTGDSMETTSQPDNSGWGAVGSIAGALFSAI
jgi:hypothetical protein